MFRLSRMTDYGIVLMTHLAQCSPDETHASRELSLETGVPHPMTSKLLKSLTRVGLLVSQRGSKGGYQLAREPEQISVAEMIAALEGPIGLTECAVHPGNCAKELSCHVRAPWQRINAVVRKALDEVTLADLATPSHSILPEEPARLALPGVDSRDH